jgi:hypothetical protein
MKPLSDSLMELAQRVKRLEESAAAAHRDDGLEQEHHRAQIQEAIEREVKLFEAEAEAQGASLRRRGDTRRLGEHDGGGRADAERPRKDAATLDELVRTAEVAEQDARAAIALARYTLNEAEYAVLDAALARAEANSVAERTVTG